MRFLYGEQFKGNASASGIESVIDQIKVNILFFLSVMLTFFNILARPKAHNLNLMPLLTNIY
ncbi:hypothetical protein GCM10017764_21060 [Sphingobacterium griseoflavum]|uniref:Uncharacterized protein n=1 Tax=Sphingobacterium griseoflavum TaxID=1474952 RepID=A0ABQ3I0G0_9SPHI|nr:hypothetical protein GCM10017764_21060 [Sphingobacterium griseoflavum]